MPRALFFCEKCHYCSETQRGLSTHIGMQHKAKKPIHNSSSQDSIPGEPTHNVEDDEELIYDDFPLAIGCVQNDTDTDEIHDSHQTTQPRPMPQDIDDYSPYGSKEELEMSYWLASGNVTRSQIDRLARIGIYNSEGKRIAFPASIYSRKAAEIKLEHAQLNGGEFLTQDLGKLRNSNHYHFIEKNCARFFFWPDWLSLEQEISDCF